MVTELHRTLRADTRQAMGLPFWLAVFGSGLCIVLDTVQDMRFALLGPREIVAQTGYCIQYFYFHSLVFGGVFCGYLLSILAAIPYAASYSRELQWRVMLYALPRSGRKNYYRSKLLVTVLSGGLAVSLGLLCIFLLLGLRLPITNEMNLFELQDMPYAGYLTIHGGLPYLAIVAYLLFLQGMLWAGFGLCLSAFLPNPYLAICSPMMLQFTLVELGRLLHLPMEHRLDLLLCGRAALGSDEQTLCLLTLLVLISVIVFSLVFSWRCERRLHDAS